MLHGSRIGVASIGRGALHADLPMMFRDFVDSPVLSGTRSPSRGGGGKHGQAWVVRRLTPHSIFGLVIKSDQCFVMYLLSAEASSY